jgi:hypothetical protein
MTDVASKQHTTVLFLSTTVTRTRRPTELKKKTTDKPDGKPVLCQITFSSIFRAVFYTVKLHSLTYKVYALLPAPALILGDCSSHCSRITLPWLRTPPQTHMPSTSVIGRPAKEGLTSLAGQLLGKNQANYIR